MRIILILYLSPITIHEIPIDKVNGITFIYKIINIILLIDKN